jgi:hypothetical protein
VIRRRVLTGLAALLVLAVLLLPADFAQLTPAAFVALPVEALLAVAVVLLLPERPRRIVAVVAGVVVGLLAVVKLLDLGFGFALDRTFDPLADWTLVRSGQEFVTESFGRAGGIAATIGLLLLAVALPVLLALAAMRLSRVVAHRPLVARRVAGGLAVVWVALTVAGLPGAAWTTTKVAYDHAARLRTDLADQAAYEREATVDAYRATPGPQLLTALRGKDVVFAFVESYGRVALDDPRIAPTVRSALSAGTSDLTAAGYATRSAFLTSPTTGGQSWLAHATLQSGLRIDSQRRYQAFTGGDRFTLAAAFHRAGWRTVSVAPANSRDWPEGDVYGYDQTYDVRTLGYDGPRFSFSSIPDQFTLAALQRAERDRAGRAPVMAEVDLVSSHAPWSPVPPLVDWATLGDGTVYGTTTGAGDSPNTVFQKDIARVRTDFAATIAYSLSSLTSYVETHGDDDLVVVLLGDHQPAPIISGQDAVPQVPISIVARDPAVLDRIAGWGWTAGLEPAPDAPVVPMEDFRDRFLAAYGPSAG